MADPHIAKKLLEGRPDDIRQCVGANYCIDRIYVGGEALCIQNPATGREATMPHDIELAAGPARARSWLSAPARRGWRRPGSRRSAVIKWCCSKPSRAPADR